VIRDLGVKPASIAREAELLDPVADLIAIESEQRRRARLIPAGTLQGLNHEVAFEAFEIDAGWRQVHFSASATAHVWKCKVPRVQKLTVGNEHGAFENRPELANIPRPRVRLDRLDGIGADASDMLPELLIEHLDVVTYQGLEVSGSRAERWDVNDLGAQAAAPLTRNHRRPACGIDIAVR
jgi:hypothetical protein